jgi:hypothetical protein
MEHNKCSLLYFCAGTIPNLAHDMLRQGQTAQGSAMPHRNVLKLDAEHNSAVRAEIAERLRILLSKDQPRPSPRIQHLLDRLSKLDATVGVGRKRAA